MWNFGLIHLWKCSLIHTGPYVQNLNNVCLYFYVCGIRRLKVENQSELKFAGLFISKLSFRRKL